MACSEIPLRKCGDMTYQSYLARRCGRCIDQQERKEEMEVTLNGVKMSGTPEQIAAVARQLGVEVGNDGVYYLSSSRGLIRITDMQDEHLKRTIAKRTREWANNLSNLDGAAFVREVTNGTRDITTLAMVREYTSRVARGLTKRVF